MFLLYQCCGTIMIYCGSSSGSDFGKVTFGGSGSRQYLAQFFNKKKLVQNLAFSMSVAALFPRKLASGFFYYFYFILCFIQIKIGSETGTAMHSGSGSAKAKSCAPFSQHWTVPYLMTFSVRNIRRSPSTPRCTIPSARAPSSTCSVS